MQVTKTLRIRDLTVELNVDHITIATKRGVAVKLSDPEELKALEDLLFDARIAQEPDEGRIGGRIAELEATA